MVIREYYGGLNEVTRVCREGGNIKSEKNIMTEAEVLGGRLAVKEFRRPRGARKSEKADFLPEPPVGIWSS